MAAGHRRFAGDARAWLSPMAERDTDDTATRKGRRRARVPEDPTSVQERLIVERLADLRTTELTEVMTPRVDVTFLSMPVTPEAVADAIRDSGHRAFPVALHDELDDVDGVLFVSDLFRSSKGTRSLGASLPDTTEISSKVRRPPLLLPESMGVLEALAEMRVTSQDVRRRARRVRRRRRRRHAA